MTRRGTCRPTVVPRHWLGYGTGAREPPSAAATATASSVPKRVEISNGALQGLFSELDRAALANDLLKGVVRRLRRVRRVARVLAHLRFDRVFSRITLEALATVLERSNFYVMVSSKTPRTWWRYHQGAARRQDAIVTTGRERMTCFVYVNAHFIPGLSAPSVARRFDDRVLLKVSIEDAHRPALSPLTTARACCRRRRRGSGASAFRRVAVATSRRRPSRAALARLGVPAAARVVEVEAAAA